MQPKSPPEAPQPKWQVDRHIPVASIVALAFQTVIAVWWLAGLANRVTEIETKIRELTPQTEKLIRQEERLGRIYEDVRGLRDDVKELLRPTRPALNR